MIKYRTGGTSGNRDTRLLHCRQVSREQQEIDQNTVYLLVSFIQYFYCCFYIHFFNSFFYIHFYSFFISIFYAIHLYKDIFNLIRQIYLLSSHSAENKLTRPILASVFGPILLPPRVNEDSSLVAKVIRLLISVSPYLLSFLSLLLPSSLSISFLLSHFFFVVCTIYR